MSVGDSVLRRRHSRRPGAGELGAAIGATLVRPVEGQETPRRLIRIASGCKTEEQFVAVFHRFCDGESIYIATRTPKSVGAELRFSVTLTDGEKLLEGTGAVREAYSDKTGPYARPGMLIDFDEVSELSKPLIKRLISARAKEAETRAARPSRPPKLASPKPKATRAPTQTGLPRTIPPGMIGIKKATTSPPNGRATILGLPPPVTPKPPRAPTPPPIPMSLRRRRPASSLDIGWDGADSDEPGTETQSEDDTSAIAKAAASVDAGPATEAASTVEPSVAEAKTIETNEAAETALPVDATPTEAATAAEPADDGDAAESATSAEVAGPAEPETPPETAAPEQAEAAEDGGRSVEPNVRVQGSNFVLPANPLMEFEDESLEAFIDCKLYEEDSDEPEPEAARTVAAMEAPAADVPARPQTENDDAETSNQVYDPEESELAMVANSISLRTALVAAAAVFFVGVGIGYLLFGGEKAPAEIAASVTPEKAVATSKATATVPTPAPSEAIAPKTEPESTHKRTAEPEPSTEPSAASDECSVEIKTRSKGARVYIGRKKIGDAPGLLAVPCGRVSLRLEHPRRRSLTLKAKTSPGDVTSLAAKMQRPTFKLRVRSSPVGATVRVNGRTLGKAPKTIEVDGFQKVTVTASKPGYQSRTKKIYAKSNRSVLVGLKKK